MSTRRKRLLWAAGALVLVIVLCLLFIFPGWLLQTQDTERIDLSTGEVITLCKPSLLPYTGPPAFDLRQDLKSWSLLKMHLRLLFGSKLSPFANTDVSVDSLAAWYAHYANCPRVSLSQAGHDLRLGNFDSGHYSTRWRAAEAIRKLVTGAGFHVVRLKDNEAAILSQEDYEGVSLATSPMKQEKALEAFDKSTNQLEKQAAARVLTVLWNADFLAEPVKKRLLEEHYHLVLRQLAMDEGFAGWDVCAEQTFPFPEVQTQFTPTLYVNNKERWAPGAPQKSGAMTIGDSLASMSGGWLGLANNFGITNGVVLKLKMELKQRVRNRDWRITLWSNELTFKAAD